MDTFAYADSECHADAHQETGPQSLKIRQRNGETITVVELPPLGPVPPSGDCLFFGQYADGPSSVVGFPLQRLGVSPDGSTVVFEVTDDFSPLAIVPPEQEGIFAVRADGSGLRKLGPPSRDPCFRVAEAPSVDNTDEPSFGFSPDGGRVTFTDRGPAPDGQDAVQVVTLDLATGIRQQITQLPRLRPVSPSRQTVNAPSFIDGNQVVFVINSVEDGLTFVIVHADGGGEISRESVPVVTGGGFIPQFLITQQASVALAIPLRTFAVNPLPGTAFAFVSEVFVVGAAHGGERLQLTNFGRRDTGGAGSLLSPDGSRVLFTATADPFGTNPDANCQFFSIDVLGADLRQVTTLANGERNIEGCSYPHTGCTVGVVGAEPATDAVLFASNCDPLSGRSNGNDVFAMRFDGSGLVQLTKTRGLTTDADGTVDVELPGPFAYPQTFR